MIYTGIFYWILRGMEPWTLKHKGNSNILNTSVDLKHLYIEKVYCRGVFISRAYNCSSFGSVRVGPEALTKLCLYCRDI